MCKYYYIKNRILESLASFAKSPIKRLAVHKVQPALALLPQLYKIHSNLLRILSKVGIFGDLCKLSLQALDSTQSTIFACLQASSLQISLESSSPPRIKEFAGLQKKPKINHLRKKSAECLEDFSLSEHQNIRKAVLCVLPKEFCVRRSEKDPMIQGFKFWRVR